MKKKNYLLSIIFNKYQMLNNDLTSSLFTQKLPLFVPDLESSDLKSGLSSQLSPDQKLFGLTKIENNR